MGIPLLQIDAFADKPFAGNPAAVCLLDKARDAAWMQSVALEMNLAETAFVVPRTNGTTPGTHPGYDLRWFTPAIEVDLCGHATLASAHGLWETGRLPSDVPARFHTRSGWLTCTRADEWIAMDFPARPAVECPVPEGLMAALGLPAAARPVWCGRNPVAYVVVLDSEATLRALNPNFAALKKLSGDHGAIHGAIVTARGAAPYDFVSRFFAPGAGIDEDPVTGSAHCALAPYWAGVLGKTSLTAYQASARGGALRLEVKGDRVVLGGQAVTVLRGELL